MLFTVDKCKRKWRNLRDAYHAEIRRIERRRNRDFILGIPYNKNIYKSKWVYFNEMEFMRNYKRRSSFRADYDNTNSNGDDYGEPDNDSQDNNFNTSINIKMEPYDDNMTEKSHSMSDHFEHDEFIFNDNKTNSDMAFEDFENMEVNESLANQSGFENVQDNHKNPSPVNNSNSKHGLKNTDLLGYGQNLSNTMNSAEKVQHLSLPSSSSLKENKGDCVCSKRSHPHVHFMENFCKKQKLMVSTTQTTSVIKNLLQIGDSDYNFLISFLPQIKKMNTLQNLQFRAKISKIVLNTLAPTMPGQ